MFYTHTDGRRSQHPVTIEEARRLRSVRYSTLERCIVCNVSSARHTHSDECVYCAMKNAAIFYNFHNKTDNLLVDEDSGAHYTNSTAGGFELIPVDRLYQLGLLSAMINGNPSLSISKHPCKKAGHVGVKDSDNCHLCNIERSPREMALDNGHTKYTPVRPCPKCNTLSPKRVDNGACDGCKPSKLSAADVALMRDCPDMILSKGDADMMGLGVFKEEGHTGWHFVKGGKSVVRSL